MFAVFSLSAPEKEAEALLLMRVLENLKNRGSLYHHHPPECIHIFASSDIWATV